MTALKHGLFVFFKLLSNAIYHHTQDCVLTGRLKDKLDKVLAPRKLTWQMAQKTMIRAIKGELMS